MNNRIRSMPAMLQSVDDNRSVWRGTWERVRWSAALLGAGLLVLAVLSLPDVGAW